VPNPTRRHSQARRDKRRANWKLNAPTLVKCDNPSCDGVHLAHAVCPTCGTYNGRQVIDVTPRNISAE